jgi:hypothetical protein
MLGLVIGFSVFFIGLSVLLDELWARQEGRKTFNWMSLIDEGVVGLMCGMAFHYLRMLRIDDYTLSSPWQSILLFTGCAVAAAIASEILRPYAPNPCRIVGEDTSELEAQIAERVESGQAWAYWQVQNPPYNTVLVVTFTSVAMIGAVFSWTAAPRAPSLLLGGVILMVVMIMYGGLRVCVTPERLVVRLGILGIRLLNLKSADVTSVQVHEFPPLRDFGGYGIRGGRGMKAYFLRGNRGVKLTTTQNKAYLIGSDHSERLAAVIRAAAMAR